MAGPPATTVSPKPIPRRTFAGALRQLAVGEHLIEVRAFDRWRGEVTAITRYRLEDAEP